MSTLVLIFGILIAGSSGLTSLLVILPVQQPASPARWMVKVFACALAPVSVLAGVFGAALGIISGSLSAIIAGSFGATISLVYLLRAKGSVSDEAYSEAFGPGWESRIPAWRKAKFLTDPAAWRIPKSTAFKQTRDIAFCTIPGTSRELLCDVWEPSEEVERSGLAFLYFFGSAWVLLDKDFGTRPFFQHLVAQGHVVMDVAYRLFPETDMTGMVNDVYRAIAWMKANASTYKVDPACIVIGGGSAGAHLSMLAAFAGESREFVPPELQGSDISVRAVISLYGPMDLEALYFHTGQHFTTRAKSDPEKKDAVMPSWIRKAMGKNFHRLGMDKTARPGILPDILGCQPDECPERYRAFSPYTHVHENCPPTLIMQGEHDIITPVHAARDLYNRLTSAHVPTVMFNIPQTDHAFDLVMPRVSLVAHTAFYAVERFLAIQAKSTKAVEEEQLMTV